MKTLKLLMLLLFFIVKLGYSQETIGDVKYSILPPAQFLKASHGWILLDGGASSQALFIKSDLHLKYGVNTLPDARGLFIRGMNEGRDGKSGDPDGNRPVGNPQTDVFKQHHH